MCVRAAQLRNVKDRHAGNNKSPREWNIPAEMKWKMFPAKIKYYPRNQIFPAEIKYSPRKWNVAIFPATEKIFPAAKNIPRGNECNNIPRGRENIPRGKIYSPRPRKYSPRQNIFPAAEKIFPAAKNIPRGRENIPRGKKYSFLCPSQASVVISCNMVRVSQHGGCRWPGAWFIFHDDVIKWKHFPRYWRFVQGIRRSPGNSRTKASDAELWNICNHHDDLHWSAYQECPSVLGCIVNMIQRGPGKQRVRQSAEYTCIKVW